jgi:hypothetical protein
MKRYATAVILSAAAISIPATASATVVKGTLRDASANETIPFATVKIFHATDTVKPAAIFVTDIDGVFSHNISRKGSYCLTFETVGKKTLVKHLTLAGQETLDLGTLDMADDVTVMKEVVVAAAKPVVKASADKLAYSVEDDSDSKTYTLLDMLRKVPMVSVDGDDNITVNGSSRFQVYVTGASLCAAIYPWWESPPSKPYKRNKSDSDPKNKLGVNNG